MRPVSRRDGHHGNAVCPALVVQIHSSGTTHAPRAAHLQAGLIAGSGAVCRRCLRTAESGVTHGRGTGHPECGGAASLDGDLPGTVERSTGCYLVARQGAQSHTRGRAGPQGTPSDSVYIVVSGRFEVWVEGQKSPINEVGVGEPIGETGFFSGATRNATIVAARDSVVLELNRASFDGVARQVPDIYQTLLRALARRLADGSLRGVTERRGVRGTHRHGDRWRPRADPAGLLRASRPGGRTPRQGPPARSPISRPPLPWPDARRPDGVQLAQRYRTRIRLDRLSGRRHAHRLDPQGDPPIRPGADRGFGRRYRRTQSGRGLRLRHASAGPPPAALRARRAHRLGQRHRRLARASRGRDAPSRFDGGRSRLQKPPSLLDRTRGGLRRRRRRWVRPGPYRRVQGVYGTRRPLRPARWRERRRGRDGWLRDDAEPRGGRHRHARRVRDQPRLQALHLAALFAARSHAVRRRAATPVSRHLHRGRVAAVFRSRNRARRLGAGTLL